MNLQEELARENSRAQADRITAWVGADRQRFGEVFARMLGNDRKSAQRAAWVVSLAGEAHPELLRGRVGVMLNHLRRPDLHPAVARAVFRLLQTVPIPGPHHNRAAQESLTALGGSAPVAVKVFAMTVLKRLAAPYPEWLAEIRALVSEQLADASPGFRSRARREFGLRG